VISRGIRLVFVLLALGAAPAMAGLPMAPTSDPDSSLVPRGVPIETDAFGNEIVRFGSGRPLTLVAVRRDVPAYFVTSITPDGYLRVQNQGSSPSLLWDQFQIGRRVFVTTTDGRVLPGVVAAPNTHFRRGDDVPIPEATVDDIYVDVGAENDKEARAMRIENLCVVSQVGPGTYEFGKGGTVPQSPRLAGPGAGTVGACEIALVLAKTLRGDRGFSRVGPLRGSVVLAWVAQGSASGRGAEVLARALKPDLAVVVSPYVPSTSDSEKTRPRDLWSYPLNVFAVGGATDSTKALAAKWASWMSAHSETGRPDPVAAALDRAGIQTIEWGLVTAYPGSPGELADYRGKTAEAGMGLASDLAGGAPQSLTFEPGGIPANPVVPSTAWPPTFSLAKQHDETWNVLRPLVQAQGVSEDEAEVRDSVLKLIPRSLKPAVDSHGNVIVRWGKGKPRSAFMAHMDEIGYHVRGVDSLGRLRVEKKGGFYDWLYEGEIVRSSGPTPGFAVVAPRGDYLVRPRPTIDSPLSDRHRVAPAGFKPLAEADVRIDPANRNETESQAWLGKNITVIKSLARLGEHRVAGRSLDDRFGCTALILALRQLAHERAPKDGCVLFAFTVQEETGLVGAEKLSDDLLAAGELPPIVHAVDTFVSSDTPLEDQRYADAKLGKGCVIRAVDTGSAAPKKAVDAVRRLAAEHFIPLQFGVTSGGNDGQPFAARGSVNVPLGWPLRYSHTQVETADLRDLEALAKLVTELARTRPAE
jgi:putative aminopeptidase FrvX